jgi:hypothetical protein
VDSHEQFGRADDLVGLLIKEFGVKASAKILKAEMPEILKDFKFGEKLGHE